MKLWHVRPAPGCTPRIRDARGAEIPGFLLSYISWCTIVVQVTVTTCAWLWSVPGVSGSPAWCVWGWWASWRRRRWAPPPRTGCCRPRPRPGPAPGRGCRAGRGCLVASVATPVRVERTESAEEKREGWDQQWGIVLQPHPPAPHKRSRHLGKYFTEKIFWKNIIILFILCSWTTLKKHVINNHHVKVI